MILELSAELFDGPTADERRSLVTLLSALDGLSEAHGILLSPLELESTPQSPLQRWLRSLSEEWQETALNLLEAGHRLNGASVPRDELQNDEGHRPGVWRRGGSLRARVERRAQSDWRELRLSLNDAIDLVHQPTTVVVENKRHDFEVVKRLATPSQGRHLRELTERPHGVQVESKSTGELTAWLNSLVDQSTLSGAEYRRLWKTWVLFDRDAGAADAREASPAVLKIIERCEAVTSRHGIPLSWVCLQRREIESYLPNEALRRSRLASAREAAGELIKWRRRGDRVGWAWAYDMKKGLLGDLRANIPADRLRLLKKRQEIPRADEIKAPFDQLQAAERRTLAWGFGEDVLNSALDAASPPDWLDLLGDEYDLGPDHQMPRAALVQSIFDRI